MEQKDSELVPISEAAKLLSVSIMTLRRWDESGRFPAIKTVGGHRMYKRPQIESYKNDITALAKEWAMGVGTKIPDEFYCPNSAVFQSRLMTMQTLLGQVKELEKNFSLIVAITGEIGDNSFAHNIGNWTDVPGIFFAYDLVRKRVVLADRGLGVLHTLSRVRPELADDQSALRMAFTEIVSGRAPEARGNGLKFVRHQVAKNSFELYFQSGSAMVEIKKGNDDLAIAESKESIRGCFALLTF